MGAELALCAATDPTRTRSRTPYVPAELLLLLLLSLLRASVKDQGDNNVRVQRGDITMPGQWDECREEPLAVCCALTVNSNHWRPAPGLSQLKTGRGVGPLGAGSRVCLCACRCGGGAIATCFLLRLKLCCSARSQ